MAAAFWSMIPGPKMMWEFGELVMIIQDVIYLQW
jgi:hypothetical protein